jgi:sterol desaturase/sphingolipid hydroxylase (fatty acid hydroxylase superfamily)
MGRMRQAVTGLGAGALVWSATEYAVHRWLMHGPHTTNPVTAEHLDHHRHLERTDPLGFDRFLWWPTAGGLVIGLPAAALTSAPAGAGAGLGFAACYCSYRHLHWWIHHRPPRTGWGRRLRRHHLRHHVGSPRGNHGVTSPLWDLVLGTFKADDGPVSLPAGIAPPWLVDERGHPDVRYADVAAIR